VTGLWLPSGTAAAFERRATPTEEAPPPSDPVEFVEHAGGFLWSRQREIARSVVENRETLVPSCHQAGKTFLAATIGAYWIAGAAPGERFLVTSAPSDRQVRALLWRELGRAHYRHGLEGSIAGTEWHIGPAGGRTLVAFGAKPQDLTNAEQAMTRFQGIHASQGVLVILDEATGIPGWLWTAVDTITGGEMDRLLAIGNPDDPTSAFAARCDAPNGSTQPPGKRYVTRLGAHVIPVDAFHTPALTGEPVPDYVRRGLINRTTVERWGEQWGTDSPLYLSKVRGVFPDRSSHNVISPALIRRAFQAEFPGTEPGCFGLDVSRSAHGDECALYRDRGGVIREVKVWRQPDATETAAIVLRETASTPAVPISVDTDGVGGPVYDLLRRGMHEVRGLHPSRQSRRVLPFSVNQSPRRPRDFDSRRSEIWWSAREELEDGMWDLDEEDAELVGQLTAPRWHVDHRGRIHVETKDELARRGISSPDRADAAIIARFGAKMATGRRALLPERNGHSEPESLTGDLLARKL
jgi:hypothetical protein